MPAKAQPVKIPEVQAQGDNIIFPFALQRPSGTIYDPTGFAITGTIRQAGGTAELVADVVGTIVSGAAGTIRLTLTKAQSAALIASDSGDPFELVEHVGDILVVESATVEYHFGPFSFNVRRKITGA
jgi:hypothetical protein